MLANCLKTAVDPQLLENRLAKALIFLRWFLESCAASGVFVSKIANLASKKNREIRQVTVAVVSGKIS